MSSRGLSRRVSKIIGLPILLVGMAAFSAPATAQTASEQAKQGARKTGNAITDGWITMKVHSQFIPEDALEGSNIDVDTTAGVVTLTGRVPTPAAKSRAVAIVKATDGVKNVIDKTTIGPAESALDKQKLREAGRTTGRTITDGWVKAKIYAQFIPEKSLEDSNIDVDITNGAVVLNGTVKTAAGKARALAIAKATDGVKSVKDALKIG